MAIARIRQSRARGAPPTRLEVLISFYTALDAIRLQRRQPTYGEHECFVTALASLQSGGLAKAMMALIHIAQSNRFRRWPPAAGFPIKPIEDWRREVDTLPR